MSKYIKLSDWSDVILFGAILVVAVIVIAVYYWIEKAIRKSNENRKLFLSPEEKQKLYNDTNGRIKPDRNAELMKSIEHDCEWDVKKYPEEWWR